MMPPESAQSLLLGPSVSWGGRLFVPVTRRVSLGGGGAGILFRSPVALLIEEDGAWSFVPLEEGIGEGILPGLEVPNPAG